MTILALDLGTTTGFAWSPAPGTIISGTWSLKPGKYDGAGMRGVKFLGHLAKLHYTSPVDRVAFEAVRRHIGTDAAHVYGGLMLVLQSWCEEMSIPYEGVPVGTIKKFWAGKGNAKKDAMIAEAVKRGFTPATDDEADALALLHFVLLEG